MEITLQELCDFCDELLQPAIFADACPNGLQVEGKPKIKKIGVAVSASLEVLERAAQEGVDALLVHHGIFWKGDSYPVVGVLKKKLSVLLKNEISLLAYHLPLDAHATIGNNWKAAREMGWENLEPFLAFNGVKIGVKGTFSPRSREVFKKQLETFYNHPAACALGGKETVSSAALVSGGAYRYMKEAAAEKVDCFITGNFDEPAWHQAFEEQINFFALGHYHTECIGIQTLGKLIAEQLLVEQLFFDSPNPF